MVLPLNVEELVEEGRVRGRVYTDPEIFDLEMERILERTWTYVAHETEISQPGDYKTTYIGRQPVIVVRDRDTGEIHALFNRCRHRGAAVCQYERGNAGHFRCSYHGWTYANSGKLIGVTFAEGYGPELDMSQLGLVRLPCVESYRGFVFASLSPDVPSLSNFLAGARSYMDRIAALGPEGVEVTAGVHKYLFRGNWKLQVENSIDPYHFSFVHKGYTEIIQRRANGVATRKPMMQRPARDLTHGHSVMDERGTGATSGLGDLPFSLNVFPTLSFVGLQIRVIRPIAADRTIVYQYPMMLKCVPPEVNARRLRGHEEFYGPAGYGTTDDVEVAFERVMLGLSATGNDWLQISRGLATQAVDETGFLTGPAGGEIPIQTLFREWAARMRAS